MEPVDVVGFDGDWMEYPKGSPRWVVDIYTIVGLEKSSELPNSTGEEGVQSPIFVIRINATGGHYTIKEEDPVLRDEMFTLIYKKLKGRQ